MEAKVKSKHKRDQKPRRKKKWSELLIEAGLLTKEQLKEALASQKQTKLKFSQFLIRQGIIKEAQIVDAISNQLKIEKYHPDNYPIDTSMAEIIPASIAKEYQVVAIKKKGGLLTVAMPDPTHIITLDTIESLTNSEVEPVICNEKEFNQLISNLYGSYSDLNGILDDIEEVQYDSEAIMGAEKTSDDLDVGSIQGMATDPPVIRLVNSVLSQAIRESVSDVHISPKKNNVQIRFRVDGKLHEVPAPPKSMFMPIISRLKILADMDIAISRVPQDGRFSITMQGKEINIRASTIPTIYGENLVLRLLDTSVGVYSLGDLGMSPEDMKKIEALIIKPYGMILSTGPTGSGKTTSLYSILKTLNQPDINIITLEDPVEFRVETIRQVQLNRKAGMTFASGLRSILRQDPDVIMVGEIRDSETATIAVQAALTGHRVLSTVHTNDSAGAITRFLDMGIEPFLVSSVMLVSIAQRLVRKICPYCKEPIRPTKEALAQWGMDEIADADFQRGKGCFNCMKTGYKGRVGIYEVLVIDDMIQEMILKGDSAYEVTKAAQQSGRLTTLKDHAADKVVNGITTLEEAASAVMTLYSNQ